MEPDDQPITDQVPELAAPFSTGQPPVLAAQPPKPKRVTFGGMVLTANILVAVMIVAVFFGASYIGFQLDSPTLSPVVVILTWVGGYATVILLVATVVLDLVFLARHSLRAGTSPRQKLWARLGLVPVLLLLTLFGVAGFAFSNQGAYGIPCLTSCLHDQGPSRQSIVAAISKASAGGYGFDLLWTNYLPDVSEFWDQGVISGDNPSDMYFSVAIRANIQGDNTSSNIGVGELNVYSARPDFDPPVNCGYDHGPVDPSSSPKLYPCTWFGQTTSGTDVYHYKEEADPMSDAYFMVYGRNIVTFVRYQSTSLSNEGIVPQDQVLKILSSVKTINVDDIINNNKLGSKRYLN